MKIAMLGHKVIPSRRGGIEKVLTMLCPLLVERGAEVTCYNRSTDKVENEYIETVQNHTYKGVRLKTAPTLDFKGISAMVASFTAAFRAAFGRYDIVHFHAEGPCAALWIPKLFGKTCVATVHGLDWQREKWAKGFGAAYIKFGERVMAKYADEIIVLSESAQDYFKQTYNRDCTLIHNGIEKPVRKEADRITQLYGLHKEDYICMVCRLTAEKGVHYLIDAYNSIKTDKKLVIAGDTSDTDSYVAMLKEKAKDNPNILFTGFISGDVLCEMYSNAYLVCQPSDLEGMSLSLLEALSYDDAVLCSDIPENVSVARDKVVYFHKSDVRDLAEKLLDLCEHAEMVHALQKEADSVVKDYRWPDIADATLALYEKALKNKGGKR